MPADPDTPLLVACLCAAWCGTCRDYRPTFEAEAARAGAAARFRWIDIEDEADLVGDELDIVDFPTLLIARGAQVLFHGPVLPHAATLQALVQRAASGALAAAPDAAAGALAARIAEV